MPVNREINFMINMVYKAKAEMANFKKDIDEIKDSVKELNNLGLEKSDAGIKQVMTTLSGFVKKVGELGTGKEFKKFASVADAFSKLAYGTNLAEDAMISLNKTIGLAAMAGESLVEKQKEIAATSGFLRGIVGTLTNLGNIKTSNLAVLSNLFDSIGKAASKFGEGGTIVPGLQKIATLKDDFTIVANAVTTICKQLSMPVVGQNADKIATMMRGGSGGGGVPFGGGGETLKGGVGGTESWRMAGGGWSPQTVTNFRDWYHHETEFMGKTFSEYSKMTVGLQGLGDPEREKGPSLPRAEELKRNIIKIRKDSEEHFRGLFERIKQMGADYSNIVEMMTGGGNLPNVIAASKLSGVFTGKAFSEEIGGRELGAVSMTRGTWVHKAVSSVFDDINKEFGTEGGIGRFISEELYASPRFRNFAIAQARQAGQDFKYEMLRGVAEIQKGPMPLPKGVLRETVKQIKFQSQIVQQDALDALYGEKSIFAQIGKIIPKNELKGLTAWAEVPITPITLLEKGATIPKTYPKEMQQEIKYMLTVGLGQMQKAGLLHSDTMKELMDYWRKEGLVVYGVGDMFLEWAKGEKRMVVDIKSSRDVNAPKKLANLFQVGTYGLSDKLTSGLKQATTFGGKGVSTGIYQPNLGTLSPTAFSIPPGEMVYETTRQAGIEKGMPPSEEEIRLKKVVVEATKRLVDVTTQLTEANKKLVDVTTQLTESRKVGAEAERILRSGAGGTEGTGGGGQGSFFFPGGGGKGGQAGGGGLLSREMFATRDAVTAYSEIDQAITKVYLKQVMFGEKIDLSKVKIEQYNAVVNNLASSFSKFVTSQDRDAALVKVAAHFEKLAEVSSRYGQKIDELSVKEQRMKDLREKTMYTLFKATPEGYGKPGHLTTAGELREAPGDYEKIISSFLGKTGEVAVPTSKAISGEVERDLKSYQNLMKEKELLLIQNKEFQASLVESIALTGKSGDANEQLVRELTPVIDGIIGENAAMETARKTVDNFEKAIEFLTQAQRAQRLEMLKQTTSSERISEVISKLRTEFDAMEINIKDSNLSYAQSSEALDYYGRSLSLIQTKRAATSETLAMMKMGLVDEKKALLDLQKQQQSGIKLTEAQTASMAAYGKSIENTQKDVKIYTDNLSKLGDMEQEYLIAQSNVSTTQNRALSRTAEHNRGYFRTTIQGFLDMMKSQTAWIAGYGVMFGAVGAFRNALGSVITIQHEFARAMRTANDSTLTAAETLDLYREKGVGAMIKFGVEAKMVGEVLYQLGSSGLTAKESLAALNSTMSMIVGTEGEVADSTKLVAAVYNNFKDQIKGTVDLQEKFQYINDVIVATFNYHQVELNELSDGYKAFLAMGKAANLTLVEMSGILGTLNDRLIRSGEAGRSMQSVLSQISKNPIQFAEAFDIVIDTSKPLEILDILRQLNLRMKTTSMSVDEMEKVFDRLGLRGARTFVTLIRDYKDLESNIERLKMTSEGAASAMADVMLRKPDVAFKQLGQTMISLVRTGFTPVVEAAASVAYWVSRIGLAANEANSTVQKYAGYLLQLVTTLGLAAGAAAAFRAVKDRMFDPTGADFKLVHAFGIRIAETFTALGSIVIALAVSIGRLVKELIVLRTVQTSLLSPLDMLKSQWANLGTVLFGSVKMLHLVGIAIAGILVYNLIDWLIVTSEEYVALTGKTAEYIETSYSEIEALKAKGQEYRNLGEATRDYLDALGDIQKTKIEDMMAKAPKSIEQTSKALESIQRQFGASLGGRPTFGVEGMSIGPEIGGRQAQEDFEKYTKDAALESRRLLDELVKNNAKTLNPLKKMRKEFYDELTQIEKEGLDKIIKQLENQARQVADAKLEMSKYITGAHEVNVVQAVEKPRQKGMYGTQVAIMAEASTLGQLAKAEYDIEKVKGRINEMAFHSGVLSKEETKALQDQGKTISEIRQIALQRAMDQKAYLVYKDQEIMADDDIGKAVKQLIELDAKRIELARQLELELKGMTRSYEDQIRGFSRGLEDMVSGMAKPGLFQQAFSMPTEQFRKIEDMTKNLDVAIEGYQKNPDVLKNFLKQNFDIDWDVFNTQFGEGLKSLTPAEGADIIKTNLLPYIDKYKELHKVQLKLAQDTAIKESDKERIQVLKDQKVAVQDIISQLKSYYSTLTDVAKGVTDIDARSEDYKIQMKTLEIELFANNVAMGAMIQKQQDAEKGVGRFTEQEKGQLEVLGKSNELIGLKMGLLSKQETLYNSFKGTDKELLRQKASIEFTDRQNTILLENSKAVADLRYQGEKYHSIQAEVAKRDREITEEVKAKSNQLLVENDTLAGQEKELKKLQQAGKDNTDQLERDIALTNLRIQGKKDEIEVLKGTREAILGQLRAELELARIQQKQQTYEGGAATSLAIQDVGTYTEFYLQGLKARQDADLKAFEESKKQDVNRYVSSEHWARMEANILKKHAIETRDAQLIMIEEEKAAQMDRLNKDAEFAVRSAQNYEEWWRSVKMSMESGALAFAMNYENISRHLADITTNSLDQIGNAMTDMLVTWVTTTGSSAEQVKEIMFNLFTSLGKMLIEYGLKLIMVSLLTKAIGGFGGGGEVKTPAGASTGAANMFPNPGAPQTFNMAQTGGYLRGGRQGKDSIPIMAMPGEYMIPKDSVDYYGKELFDRLRKREIIKAQEGGLVTERNALKTQATTTATKEEKGTVYKEGDTINYFTIKTNDVNSFRQYLYENKQFINGLVIDEQQQRR